MTFEHKYRAFLLPLVLIWSALLMPSSLSAYSDGDIDEKRVKVVMRTIGHEVLKSIGDTKSRVLPIEKSNDQYKISFERNFAFEPMMMIAIVDSVMNELNVAKGYVAEVQKCVTNEIVHSFASQNLVDPNQAACVGRKLPEACYHLLISPVAIVPYQEQLASEKENSLSSFLFIIPILLVLFLAGYYVSRSNEEETDPDIFKIGAYVFNKRTMVLSLNNQDQELSNKESELLALLNLNANQAVKRDVILQKIWGDEGDYIGRTLDVFISKLRKKLDGDDSVKIVNIRGVGYKLINT